jgi:transposase-like protein
MERTRRLFVPPHCPRSDCRYHTWSAGWRWVRYGSYERQCAPRVIPRFRCGHCRRTFSAQSFSPTYWLKRPELLAPVFQRVLTCAGYRQIAREAGCAATTVMAQVARLGRHCLLLLHELRPRGALSEPLVIDGFESFAYSQYHPLHLNLAVGAHSHFGYAFTHAELRRKGRMTAAQRRRRARIEARHGRPDPRALERGVATLLELAVPVPQAVVLRSDEHGAYPRALKRLPQHAFTHQRTTSTQARTADNPLFPVNLMDLQLRHNSANHKRETIAFSKRHSGVVDRAAILLLWCNEMKPFSERHGGGTRAMRLGLRSRAMSVAEVLQQRRFPARVGLPEPWQRYYERRLEEREIPAPRRHALTLAF